MTSETKRLLNNEYNALPNYYNVLKSDMNTGSQSQGSSSIDGSEMITYSVSRRGFLTKVIEIKDSQTDQVYNLKISNNIVKFFDSRSGQGILKLKRQGFAYNSTTWNLTYIVKNPERYQEVSMVKKGFMFGNKYTLKLKKQDNTMIILHWITASRFGGNWTLFDSQNQALLEYRIHTFKKNTLKQFKYIDGIDLPIYFISLVTLTIDADGRQHAAAVGYQAEYSVNLNKI
ncbi:hypothetical protein K502DRAFT_331186 [Neoconidiobolus thromboides FSU 785]|nr:hypothetical protein K502DRAFT_331186 [Neoconidiobolus thromboides FSU 785]